MRSILIFIITILLSIQVFAEEKDFETMLDGLLEGTVPQVDSKTLKAELQSSKLILLDTRGKDEFEVSHLKDARWAGFEDFSLERIKDLNKDTPIVLYCSVGKRSEIVGEKLKVAGFSNIRNLRGGIFDWANQGGEVYSGKKQAKTVHPYNSEWAEWLQ